MASSRNGSNLNSLRLEGWYAMVYSLVLKLRTGRRSEKDGNAARASQNPSAPGSGDMSFSVSIKDNWNLKDCGKYNMCSRCKHPIDYKDRI